MSPEPTVVTMTPAVVYRMATKWWVVFGSIAAVASAVLGGVAARSFNLGATSVHEEVASEDRAKMTKRLDALETDMTTQLRAVNDQQFTNRDIDARLKDLLEHIRQLESRATTLTSRADVMDGRYSVLADRAQQQPPPPVTTLSSGTTRR